MLLLCSCALFAACDLRRDQTIPKGVDPAEVEALPQRVTYNQEIRPLFYQFEKEGGALQELVERYQDGMLSPRELERLLESEHGSLATQSPAVRTLLWRWARQGAKSERPWLKTALPSQKFPPDDLVSPERESEIGERLRAYWLVHSGKERRAARELGTRRDQEETSAYRDWVSRAFSSSKSYRDIVAELLASIQAPPHDLRQAPRLFFPEHWAVFAEKIETFTGVQPEELSLEIPALYEALTKRRPSSQSLFSEAQLSEYERLKAQYAQCEEQIEAEKLSALALEHWLTTAPAYPELREPLYHERFEGSGGFWQSAFPPGQLKTSHAGVRVKGRTGKGRTGKGRLGKGAELRAEVGILYQQERAFNTASFAFWFKLGPQQALRLSFSGSEEVELSLTAQALELYQQKHSPRPLFESRVPWIAKGGWNCLVFTPSARAHPAGLRLLINGKEVFWPSAGNVLLPAFLSATRLTASGGGTIDDFCFFPHALSPLEEEHFWDDRAAARALQDRSASLRSHCNALYNPRYQDYCEQQRHLAVQLRMMEQNALKAPTFPDLHFEPGTPKSLVQGEDVAPLTVAFEDYQTEVIEWLFEEEKEQLARMTVHWVSEAVLGEALFDPRFPGARLPERYEEIDRYATVLIASDWNLKALAHRLLEPRSE